MPRIHVCSLSRLDATVLEHQPSHLISVINDGTLVTRPETIPVEQYLYLGFNDITEPADGLTPPGEEHVAELVRFARAWDRTQPMVIHCWAGISRSTAAAYIALCALAPNRDEAELAMALRARSPSATPNPRLVGLADRMLGRDRRMVTAIEAIGRGSDASEGEPFWLPVDG